MIMYIPRYILLVLLATNLDIDISCYQFGGISTCSDTETFCTCESTASKWYICSFVSSEYITSVDMVQRKDATSCDFNSGSPEHYNGSEGAYGYSGNLIWVSNGCRAIFETSRTTIETSRQCEFKNEYHWCGSRTSQLHWCNLAENNTIITARVVYPLFGSSCLLYKGMPANYTEPDGVFGYISYSLWVGNGCWAIFEVCTRIFLGTSLRTPTMRTKHVPSLAFFTTKNTTQREQPVTPILSTMIKLTNATVLSKGATDLKPSTSTASPTSALNQSTTSGKWLKTSITILSMPHTSPATEVVQFVVDQTSGQTNNNMTQSEYASTTSVLYLPTTIPTLNFGTETFVNPPSTYQHVLHLFTNASTTVATTRLRSMQTESTIKGLRDVGLGIVSLVGGLAVLAGVGGIVYQIFRKIACNTISPSTDAGYANTGSLSK